MRTAANATGPFSGHVSALVALIVICTAIRVFFWQIYEPGISPDTGTYLQVASDIARMDFSSYLGRRTPIYPLLLVAAQMDYTGVWLIQSFLGAGISVLIFFLMLECVPSIRLAFAVALFHSLTLNQLFLEAKVLSETLATFLVIASVLLFVRALKSDQRLLGFVLTGLCVALATLTRPQYIYLGPLYVVLMMLTAATRHRKLVIVFVAAFGLPVMGWALFNKVQVGYFGLSTQMGLSLAQHSGKFIGKAPEEFAMLRDIYLRHRALMPADADHMTVWEAVPDMLAETHLSFLDLNRQLTRLSLLLFVQHPDLYLRSVFDAWIGFWPVPNIWNPDLIRGPEIRSILQSAWSAEHAALRVMNLAFFLLAIALTPRAVVEIFRDHRVKVYVVIGSVVLVGSVFQALLEATDNARYSIPTQPLVAVFCVAVAFQCGRDRRATGKRRARRAAVRQLDTAKSRQLGRKLREKSL